MQDFSIEQWKEIFVDTGLSDKDMQKWHQCFEAKYPDAHQKFLEWLGADSSRIQKIRTASR